MITAYTATIIGTTEDAYLIKITSSPKKDNFAPSLKAVNKVGYNIVPAKVTPINSSIFKVA